MFSAALAIICFEPAARIMALSNQVVKHLLLLLLLLVIWSIHNQIIAPIRVKYSGSDAAWVTIRTCAAKA